MSRQDHAYMAEQWNSLDPDRIEAERREAERVRRWKATLAAQARNDVSDLVRDKQFIRYIFTVLEAAGIWDSTCHAQSGAQYFDAGRRALGLEILDGLTAVDPHILVALPLERLKLMELQKNAENLEVEPDAGDGE